MRVGIGRFAVPLSVLALLFAACSQSTSSTSPSGSQAAASESPSAAASGEESPSPPPPTPLPANETQAKPGDVVIRWYCCLGTGDAPEQVTVERKVADDFNASHPGIHLQFEGYVYAAAADALSVQLGAGSGPELRTALDGIYQGKILAEATGAEREPARK